MRFLNVNNTKGINYPQMSFFERNISLGVYFYLLSGYPKHFGWIFLYRHRMWNSTFNYKYRYHYRYGVTRPLRVKTAFSRFWGKQGTTLMTTQFKWFRWVFMFDRRTLTVLIKYFMRLKDYKWKWSVVTSVIDIE